jgi:hypothetical protein
MGAMVIGPHDPRDWRSRVFKSDSAKDFGSRNFSGAWLAICASVVLPPRVLNRPFRALGMVGAAFPGLRGVPLRPGLTEPGFQPGMRKNALRYAARLNGDAWVRGLTIFPMLLAAAPPR